MADAAEYGCGRVYTDACSVVGALGRIESNLRHDVEATSANIRRENAEGDGHIRRDVESVGSNIRREVAHESGSIKDRVKDAGWKVTDKVDSIGDRLAALSTAYHIASDDKMCDHGKLLEIIRTRAECGFERLHSDTHQQAERVLGKIEFGNEIVSRRILEDGIKTRELINALKMEELNRKLTERHNDLSEARGEARHWQNGFSNNQFAAVSAQLNAFQSQLQEAKQNTVNFGTMSGNAGRQQSTNNVA